jgi:hypothetical protein
MKKLILLTLCVISMPAMEDRSFVAYRYKEFTFKGEVVLTERPKNIIRYKLKSDKLYID